MITHTTGFVIGFEAFVMRTNQVSLAMILLEKSVGV
jgi:hypothetical protein